MSTHADAEKVRNALAGLEAAIIKYTPMRDALRRKLERAVWLSGRKRAKLRRIVRQAEGRIDELHAARDDCKAALAAHK